MTTSLTARMMTVIGLLLFVIPARGSAGNPPFVPPKAAARDSALPTWSGTLTDSDRPLAELQQHTQLERVPYQEIAGARQGNSGWEETIAPARRLVDESDGLVPIYALRGRVRWCTAPQEFVFCDRWTSADRSMPQDDRLPRRSPSVWRMCSCGLR